MFATLPAMKVRSMLRLCVLSLVSVHGQILPAFGRGWP
jgi:hypothetical protein